MYSSIHIRGFRGLDSFRMRGLGRVNLLVGMNNCGKTSILECIELLRSTGHPNILSSILRRRGEWSHVKDRDSEPLLDVKRLFSGYDLQGEIEPVVERIASVGIDRGPYFREAPGGVFIKLRETENRIPIGSTGDSPGPAGAQLPADP